MSPKATPSFSLKTLPQQATSLWQRLTEPDPSLLEPGQVRQARLMASLILGLLPLAIIITLRDAFVLYTTAIHPKTAIDVLGIVILLILYPVSRTKYFQVAAVVWLSLFSFFLLLESLALTDQPLKQLAVIPYQILLLLIGSMLLPIRRRRIW